MGRGLAIVVCAALAAMLGGCTDLVRRQAVAAQHGVDIALANQPRQMLRAAGVNHHRPADQIGRAHV